MSPKEIYKMKRCAVGDFAHSSFNYLVLYFYFCKNAAWPGLSLPLSTAVPRHSKQKSHNTVPLQFCVLPIQCLQKMPFLFIIEIITGITMTLKCVLVNLPYIPHQGS